MDAMNAIFEIDQSNFQKSAKKLRFVDAKKLYAFLDACLTSTASPQRTVRRTTGSVRVEKP